jgi:NADH:ubiquinone oxidoreductase subunit F (NADH-binding)
MKTLATVIKGGSLCALGQTAANPILSTMTNSLKNITLTWSIRSARPTFARS